MRELLRFQCVVLARLVNWVAVVAIAVAMLLACGARRPGFTGAAMAHIGMLIGAAVLIVGVVRTFTAVEATRWSLPLRSRDAFAAYLVFWLAAWTAFALLFVALHGTSGMRNALLEALAIVLFGGTAAAATSVIVRVQRRSRARDVVLVIVAAFLTINGTIAGIAMSLAGAPTGGVPLLAASFCIWLAAAVVARRGDERSPAGSLDARTVKTRVQEERPPRAPVVSLLRTTYASGWALTWIAFGLAMQFIAPLQFVAIIWLPIVALNLVRLGLTNWRWLLASPIDRGRAFRVLFAPAFAFVLLVTTARFAVVEFATDRTAFFHDSRTATFFTVRPQSLHLSDVLQMAADGRSYLPPDVAQMSARVRHHLDRRYDVRVDEDRIAAAIRRGWPEHPSTGIMDTDQWAVLDAMERVRADLAPELTAVSRGRDCAHSLVAILMFLLLARIEFSSRRRRYLGVIAISLLVVALLVLALVLRGPSASDWLYAPFADAPWPVTLLVLVATALAVAFLWRSSARALRRMDLIDLPYPQDAWGFPKKPSRRTDH